MRADSNRMEFNHYNNGMRDLSEAHSMPVFLYAYGLIKKLSLKDSVAVCTRESGFLFFLVKLRRKLKNVRGFYQLHDLYADLSWVEKKESFIDGNGFTSISSCPGLTVSSA
jgi:hypothetical protein